jgi:hypothetical protein
MKTGIGGCDHQFAGCLPNCCRHAPTPFSQRIFSLLRNSMPTHRA